MIVSRCSDLALEISSPDPSVVSPVCIGCYRAGLLVFEGSFMLIVGAINVVLGVWVEYLRQTEMTRKLSGILSDVTSKQLVSHV